MNVFYTRPECTNIVRTPAARPRPRLWKPVDPLRIMSPPPIPSRPYSVKDYMITHFPSPEQNSQPAPLKKTKKAKSRVYELSHVVGHRLVNGKQMFKVRWSGYSAKHDTFEYPSCALSPQSRAEFALYKKKHNL